MKVKFSRCNSNSLANVPQVDGQLIYVKDTSEVYMDVGNNRNKLSDVIEVADITNVQNPIISKIYYDEATENLYKYIDNEWKSLGGDFTPQVYFWDGNRQTGLTFWNNIMKVNEDNDVVVLYTFSDFSLSTIIKIPQGTIKTKKVTNWYDYYDLASNSSNVTYSAMKARVKFTIENDVITTYTIETTTVASMSVLETNKDYATPYVPLYDGSPANKKYVDDSFLNSYVNIPIEVINLDGDSTPEEIFAAFGGKQKLQDIIVELRKGKCAYFVDINEEYNEDEQPHLEIGSSLAFIIRYGINSVDTHLIEIELEWSNGYNRSIIFLGVGYEDDELTIMSDDEVGINRMDLEFSLLENVLEKENTTPFTPTEDYNPATKKYVDDKCIPYQPFPSGLDTSHTTQDFITSIKALNLSSGSTYLGGVNLTDMPFLGNGEVEFYVYPGNVIYLVLRSANISPYMWECNSHTFRGWEAVGKAYTDNALTNYVQNTDYATGNTGGLIKTGNGFSATSNGYLTTSSYTYPEYITKANAIFIGKGTLETIINSSILKTGSTTPTTSTVGYRVGQLYLNTTDNKVYQLIAIDDTDPNAIVYTWQQLVTISDLSNYTPASSATTFDNTGTGLQATNIQDAIEELLSKISTLETTVGQVDEILDEIIGDNTDITDVVYTANNFTLNSETGYYEMSGATQTDTNLEISFTKATTGNVVLSYEGNKLISMESYTTIQLDDGDTDGLSSSVEYTNYVLENVSAGSHTIRVEISSGDPSTSLSIKLVV